MSHSAERERERERERILMVVGTPTCHLVRDESY